MSKLQKTQDYLKENIDGFVTCAVVDVGSAISLAGASIDPNFDISVPSAMCSEIIKTSRQAFEVVGWGMPYEVLMPGDTHTVLLFCLVPGVIFEVISVSSKTPLGMVRAIFNKIKAQTVEALP